MHGGAAQVVSVAHSNHREVRNIRVEYGIAGVFSPEGRQTQKSRGASQGELPEERLPRGLRCLLEKALRKQPEVVLPMGCVVTVAVHVPNMRHLLLFEKGVESLADPDQTVLVAAGQP